MKSFLLPLFFAGMLCGQSLSVSGYYLTDGTNYYIGPTNQIATLPSGSSFSWVNQGTASESSNGNALVLHAPASGGADLRIREQSIGSNTTLTAAMICDLAAGGTNSACTMGFRESATGKVEELHFTTNTSNSSSGAYVIRFSSPTQWNSNVFNTSGVLFPSLSGVTWIQLTIANGTIRFSYSTDGVNFPILYSEAQNAWFSSAPDQWFYGADSEGNTQDAYTTLLSWNPLP
jgi:hypothetical protein